MQNFDWNAERVKTLKSLWPTHSAAQIADKFGEGVTRNSVIGKAHRLGLKLKQPGYNAPHGSNERKRKSSK